MTDYSEPYWCDEHDPPVKCYDYCHICAEDDLLNWEEKDWELAKKYNVPCFNLYNEEDKQRLIKFVEAE